MKIASVFLIGMAILYSVLCGWMYFFQRKILYEPTFVDTRGMGNGDFTPWKTPDNQFHGYVRIGLNAKRAILLFHGNSGEALDRKWLADLVPQEEVILVLAEYPGYGARDGQPNQQNLVLAAQSLVQATQARWSLPITIVGESLGSGVASHVAALESHVDRLALISPFTSIVDVAKERYFYLPVSFFIEDPFYSDRVVQRLSIPVSIIHGADDRVVPIDHGKKLFEAVSSSEKFWTELSGVGHGANMVDALKSRPEAMPFRRFLFGA